MSKRLGVLLFVALAALFLVANRGAYRGYFQDDEFDTLSWARYGGVAEYAKGVVSPLFQKNNFRPTGHFYFYAAEHFAGLDFPNYVAVLHFFHLFNVWLVWLLARRLGASAIPAGASALFFALHMALFDAVWKPMYVFDVLCATFCLLSVLFYSRERWVLSFLSFWLAYKAKELAVMLPVVLAVYELWFGKRRWKPLVPFFAVSLSFGLQGLLLNPNRDNEYTFRFTLAALAKTSVYYAGRVFLVPYLGFVVPLVLLIGALMRAGSKTPRLWFGIAMMALFFFPLLFLPGRLFAAYCYVPFTGLAIALSGVAEMVHPGWVVVFLLGFVPLDAHSLRVQQRATLAKDDDVRAWAGTLGGFARTGAAVDEFVVDGAPDGFARWGVEGAVKYLFRRLDPKIFYAGDPEVAKILPTESVVVLRWDGARHALDIVQHGGSGSVQ
jgi:hypothetical protein